MGKINLKTNLNSLMFFFCVMNFRLEKECNVSLGKHKSFVKQACREILREPEFVNLINRYNQQEQLQHSDVTEQMYVTMTTKDATHATNDNQQG